MPKSLERCIQEVKKTVKPRDPEQTQEEAAWAICTDAYNRKKKSSADEIKTIANSIKTRESSIASKLIRIAQSLDGMMGGSPPQMAMPMSQEPSMEQPSPDVNIDLGGEGQGAPPQIESFHKPIKNVRTHKITMTFEAPPDMSEGDIMDTFFDIMPNSGLQPINFSWADATPTNDGSKSTTSKR